MGAFEPKKDIFNPNVPNLIAYKKDKLSTHICLILRKSL